MQIEKNVSVGSLTTFHIEAKASRLLTLKSEDELPALCEAFRAEKGAARRPLILGAGSNVLFTGDYDGLVAVNRLTGVRELEPGPEGEYRFRAASGETMDHLVRMLTLSGHPGLENLVLIPGSVGGAAVQNIGAYGLEAAERIESVEICDLEDGSRRVLSCEECDFRYRDSVFKRPQAASWLVTAVTFSLPAPQDWRPVTGYKGLAAALEGKPLDAAAVMHAVEALRRAKLPDPEAVGNAGSFFKNPVIPELQARALLESYPSLVSYPLGGRRTKLAAGWLIEAAGFKGASVGAAAVWDRQALVLVNRGGATGRDVEALCARIIEGIERKFGVRLTPEVVIL